MTECLCPLCSSTRCELAETTEPPHRLVRCADCSLVFVDPIPDSGELSRHYDQDYYAEWVSTQRDKRERMWSRRLKGIENKSTGGDILDVGCGDGLFLELAKRNGWRVQGTDVSAYAAGFASERLGQSVFCGEIWDAGFHEQSFDVVTLWHVLEHTTQPACVLHEVRRVLKAGGTLVLAVPNLNDHLMRLAYRLVKGRRLRRFSLRDKEIHLFHFSVNSIRRLLDAAGFECQQIGPDFGIVELAYRLVNWPAAVLFYILGVHWYNSIQAVASPK